MSLAKIMAAQDAVWKSTAGYIAAIEAVFPKGSRVNCRFSDRQKNDTQCTVIAALSDGRVAVQLDTINHRGRQTVKRCYWPRMSRIGGSA